MISYFGCCLAALTCRRVLASTAGEGLSAIGREERKQARLHS